jgi:hypothetical protein
VLISGDLSITENNDILASTGTVGFPAITGNLAVTEANDSLSSTSTTAIIAHAAILEAADLLSSTATTSIEANATITEMADLLASTARAIIVGNLNITEADDEPLTPVFANLSVTEDSDVSFGFVVQKEYPSPDGGPGISYPNPLTDIRGAMGLPVPSQTAS